MDSIDYFRNYNPLLLGIQYLQGVPNLNSPFIIDFSPDKTGVSFIDAISKEKRFYLHEKNIINISIEDQSTIENRVGFKRLLLVGVFAIAWKKKKKNPISFMIIEYKNDFGETQEMYIQSTKASGFQDFTNLKYNLKRYWLSSKESPEFNKKLEEIKNAEIKAKKLLEENRIKSKKRTKRFTIGCLILLGVVFLLFAIIIIIALLYG